jgi:methylated-DNA-protein-cysteine methyltransferase-like protein
MLDLPAWSYEVVPGGATGLDADSTNLPDFHAICRRSENGMSWDPVYKLVKKIPRGRVTTYGELAKALRLRGGARAAGYAMAACPGGRTIPWHRVVGAGGKLLISEPHSSLQRRLLETEGVAIGGRRVDMKRFAWTPKKTGPKLKSRTRVRSRSQARRRSRLR